MGFNRVQIWSIALIITLAYNTTNSNTFYFLYFNIVRYNLYCQWIKNCEPHFYELLSYSSNREKVNVFSNAITLVLIQKIVLFTAAPHLIINAYVKEF